MPISDWPKLYKFGKINVGNKRRTKGETCYQKSLNFREIKLPGQIPLGQNLNLGKYSEIKKTKENLKKLFRQLIPPIRGDLIGNIE